MSQDLYSRLGLPQKWNVRPTVGLESLPRADTQPSSASEFLHSQTDLSMSDSQHSAEQEAQLPPHQSHLCFPQTKSRGLSSTSFPRGHAVAQKLEGLESVLSTISTSLTSLGSRIGQLQMAMESEASKLDSFRSEISSAMTKQTKVDRLREEALQQQLQEAHEQHLAAYDELVERTAADKQDILEHVSKVAKELTSQSDCRRETDRLFTGPDGGRKKRKRPYVCASAKRQAIRGRLQCVLKLTTIGSDDDWFAPSPEKQISP